MQDLSPEQAQGRFVGDIGPELHQKAGFVLLREKPGHLVFSDGVRDAVPFADRTGPDRTGLDHSLARETSVFVGRDGGEYSLLRGLLAHRIKVDFEADGSGTRVAVRGAAARDIRHAIDLLGQPGHWPEMGGSRARRADRSSLR
jgi:hypothetical protein